MKFNDSYRIIRRENEMLLCNIENGDVYQINDVTAYTLSQCQNIATPRELSEAVYEHFKETDGDFSQSDMYQFVQQLMVEGIIL